MNTKTLRAEIKAQTEALFADYAEHGDARRLLLARSQQVDTLLRQLWQEQAIPATLALVAVGGYGRGELFPYSDVDVLILLPDQPDTELQGKLEALIGRFWDIGLEVGHSVRTVDECASEARHDITVMTALIESRLICGAETLYQQFTRQREMDFDPQAFYQAKVLEQRERYLKHNETPYSLEPNCKESPGGLRDLHVIFWVARAAGYGTQWTDLVRHGLLTEEEAARFAAGEDFLNHIRIRLHRIAGRREDRLLFDHQSALAEAFGYHALPGKRASEALMQEYYRTAKAVMLLNSILLQNIGTALQTEEASIPEALDDDFQIIDGRLDVRDEKLFERKPLSILLAFRRMQQRADLHGMTARTLRALWRAGELITPEFRADPAAKALFLELLQAPRGVLHEFRRMNQLDILGAYLPCFGRIVGQMQHDLFHVYTVDQHTLQVLRNLRRFAAEEFAHEYPVSSRLINEFDRPWLLYIAALFHDIAKGRGGDHSDLGMVDAAEFCSNHGLSPEDSELVVWLVGTHLIMSHVAQKEDISDPDVVAAFAERVRDERHLTALYLLTGADIRGTSPKVWNHWKAQLLLDLYQATRRHLERGQTPERHGIIAERRAEALRLLRFYALQETAHEKLWEQFDTLYFLRHSADEIAWHTRALYHRTESEEAIVRARVALQGGGLQVMVYARDRNDLFCHLAGFFARAGYNIVDAKIHTTRHGYALDSFILLHTTEHGSDRDMIAYIEHELASLLANPSAPEAPAPGRLSRQMRHFPIKPRLEIRPDEKGSHYLLSLIAADRPGLLYQVASQLARHGIRLHTAKIATLGERAEDVFLISGPQLGDDAQRLRLEQELLAVLKI